MIFTARSGARTAKVRAALIGILLVLIATVLYFVYARYDPRHGCAECVGITYTSQEIPAHYIAITFDYGPHPNATPALLNALDRHGVPATFFLLGQLVVRHPELVQEIDRRGYLLGNHTFSHEETIHKTEGRIVWELNTTNKLIETLTEKSAILYRPPYLLDTEDYEVTPKGVDTSVWDWVREHGYVPVGADLDSLDWKVSTREGVLQNVQAIISEKKNNPEAVHRHVILFHDEPQTAAALEEAIVMLKREGFEIVPLVDLLGLTTAEAMPPAERNASHVFYHGLIVLIGTFQPIVAVLFVLLTIVTFGRPILFILIKQRTSAKPLHVPAGKSQNTVAVLVPAYNESANIRATVESVLSNTVIPNEVVIIDDGSTDDTFMHAEELARLYQGVVRVVRLKNGGKARALNIGLAHVQSDVVVCIDGDTVLGRECVESLLPHFADPSVGAVAGKIVPAATKNLVEKFQDIEYAVGQNLEKHALGLVGSVNVVPGAIGAWRRQAIKLVGGYSTETLVEDQDLSLALLSEGYSVRYEPRAIGYTEVPSTARGLVLQRIRWTYGTFQCVWKYRSRIMDVSTWRLGFVALPYAALFNVTLPVVTLLLHGILILSIFMRMVHPSLLFLFLYTLIDVVYTAYALKGERARTQRLLLVPLQRVFFIGFYTFVIGYVCMKTLDGSRTRWNKLKRNGSAQALYQANADTPLFVSPRPIQAGS